MRLIEFASLIDSTDEKMEDDTENSPEVSQESESMDVPVPQKAAASPEPPVVVVEGGRRRGRRRIMKKKTMKDEEGYLGFAFPLPFQRILFLF